MQMWYADDATLNMSIYRYEKFYIGITIVKFILIRILAYRFIVTTSLVSGV